MDVLAAYNDSDEEPVIPAPHPASHPPQAAPPAPSPPPVRAAPIPEPDAALPSAPASAPTGPEIPPPGPAIRPGVTPHLPVPAPGHFAPLPVPGYAPYPQPVPVPVQVQVPVPQALPAYRPPLLPGGYAPLAPGHPMAGLWPAPPAAAVAAVGVADAVRSGRVCCATGAARADWRAEQDGWVEYRTAEGKPYYHNLRTRATVWQRPGPSPSLSPSAGTVVTPAAPTGTATGKKPVSWEPIGGTEWRRVRTADGDTLFFHPKTKTSAWTLPPDAAAAAAAAAPAQGPTPADAAPGAGAVQPEQELAQGLKRAPPDQGPEGAAGAGEPALEPEAKRARPASPPVPTGAAEGAESQVAGDASEGAKTEEKKEEQKAAQDEKEAGAAAEAASAAAAAAPAAEAEAEAEAARRLEAFRALLREKVTGPFPQWDKELPRLAFDPRFALLARMQDRRAEFDAFVRLRTEEERSGKIQATQRLKEARAAYVRLLEEQMPSEAEAPSWDELRRRLRAHAVFLAVEAKDRERLYMERRDALRRQAADAHAAMRRRFLDFLAAALRDRDPDSWRRTRRALDEADEGWADTFRGLRDREQEELWTEHRRAGRAREAERREREREGRKVRESAEREMERRRDRLQHEEAVRALQVALRERCRSLDLGWKEAAALLAGDPRFETEELRTEEKEDLFHEHQAAVRESARAEFRAYLNELTAHGELGLASEWETVRAALEAKADKRFRALPEKERASAFDRHLRDLVSEARDAFLQLLRDTRSVHRETPTSGPGLEQTKRLLAADARFTRLEALGRERDRWLLDYIATQAPPPPVAGQLRAQLAAQDVEEGNGPQQRFSIAMMGQSNLI